MREESEPFLQIGARVQGVRQGTAAHQFHCVIQIAAFSAADFVHGHDRRVFEARGDPPFLQETRGHGGGVSHGALLGQDHARFRSGEQFLERDIPAHLDVMRQEDPSHASAPVFRCHGVAPGDLIDGVDQRGAWKLEGAVLHQGGSPPAGIRGG